MKVGDYVRFDYHRVSMPIQIARIEYIFYDEEEKYNIYRTDVGAVITNENIIGKPSSNPIDLIEVGDYVNGHKVIYTIGNIHKRIYVEYVNMDELLEITSEQIKSIVTKEQFKSMEYEVE